MVVLIVVTGAINGVGGVVGSLCLGRLMSKGLFSLSGAWVLIIFAGGKAIVRIKSSSTVLIGCFWLGDTG